MIVVFQTLICDLRIQSVNEVIVQCSIFKLTTMTRMMQAMHEFFGKPFVLVVNVKLVCKRAINELIFTNDQAVLCPRPTQRIVDYLCLP